LLPPGWYSVPSPVKCCADSSCRFLACFTAASKDCRLARCSSSCLRFLAKLEWSKGSSSPSTLRNHLKSRSYRSCSQNCRSLLIAYSAIKRQLFSGFTLRMGWWAGISSSGSIHPSVVTWREVVPRIQLPPQPPPGRPPRSLPTNLPAPPPSCATLIGVLLRWTRPEGSFPLLSGLWCPQSRSEEY